MNTFNRPRPLQGADLTLGIEKFAPEFWKLIADQSTPEPPSPPSSPQIVPPLPQKPPLTHDGLEAQRDSLPGFADQLGDIPSPSASPYPPFTGGPPLTNERLRDLRNETDGAGYLQDIPAIPESKLPRQLPPDYSANMERLIREIGQRRGEIERLRAEISRRPPSQAKAFETEILAKENELRILEQSLAESTKNGSVKT